MRGLLLSALAAALLPLWAAEVQPTLLLRTEAAAYTDKSELQKAEAFMRLKVDVNFDDGGKFVAIGRLRGDLKDNLYPDKFESSNYSDFSKPLALGTSGVAELRELYYQKSFGANILKIGKMQSVWGRADGIKLLDVLNPQDFSEFILPSFEESRIPLWSLSLTHSFEESELELIWIPDITYAKLPQVGSDYSFTTPRVVPQAAPRGIRVRQESVAKPNNTFADSDIALRYGMSPGDLEMSFYGLYAYDDIPVFFQNFDAASRTVTLSPRYERYKLAGFSADYAKGDFVYRLEAAYTSGRYFRNTLSSQGVKKSDTIAYLLGIDWYGLEQSLLSMQISQSFLLENSGGFTIPKTDNTITLLYKKDMLNDTLHAEALLIHNINDGDGLFRPKLSYELDEETLLYGGVDLFYGDKEGLYGEFRDKSRVVLGIERTF